MQVDKMEDLNDLEKKIKSPLDLPKTILKKKVLMMI
jgi:hypothetical protein